MSNHTPGPWEINEEEYYPLNLHVHSIRVKDTNEEICDTAYWTHKENLGESRCNALLIAAAPDLLKALERIMGKAYKQNWNDNYPEEVAQAEAAIDKANGLKRL